jgi:serine/threonine protein kinase/tetratricopeptide (TPR) repeat protein
VAIKCPRCHSENADTALYCSNCATSLTAPGEPGVSVTRTIETTTNELTRGTTFAGRYEIIEELGAGGMGRVYRAHDTKLNEEVALKLIKPEIAAEKRVVERFRNELKMARKITHKNVCRMYDFHEEGKTLYLTMEYVRGEDLKSLVHRTKALTVGAAMAISRQIAEGLTEAHRLGITHRDLKPGNIMIDKDGQAKIMDFGIARVRQERGITGEGAVIGTPEYMSPEQVEGKEADARSDIYALGVILFEMLIGRAPFEGETPFSIANKHKTEPPPIPKKLVPQIPEGLNNLILRCLEKDRAKRYQTAEELIADLSSVEQALPVTDRIVPRARTKPSHEITVTFAPRKLLVPSLALLGVAATVIILGKVIHKKEVLISQAGRPSVAILYFKNNTGDKNLDMWRAGLSDLMISKLSQSRFIRVIDPSQMYGILKKLNLLERSNYTPEELNEISRRLLASHIVRGSLSKAGEQYRIELTLQSVPKLDIVAAENMDGTGDGSILTMVDNLAERLKTNLGLSSGQIATDINRDLGSVLSTSSEAVKFYLQGYRLSLLNNVNESIRCLEKAIALDPQFAMAYYWMSSDYSFYFRMKEARTYAQKAFDLRERVSEHDRYLIEANLYGLSEKTWDKSIEAYTKLTALYPDDLIADEGLGTIYFQLEEWDKAIEKWEVLRRYKTESVGTYQGLSVCYLAKGQPDKARDVLEGYLETMGDNGFIRGNLVTAYCILGELDKAKKEADKAYAQMPASVLMFKRLYLLCAEDFAALEALYKEWEVTPNVPYPISGQSTAFALRGRLREARTSFERNLKKYKEKVDPASVPGVFSLLGDFLGKTGDVPSALSACGTAIQLARERGDRFKECIALYCRGIVEAQANKLTEAMQTAEEVRQAVEDGPVKKRIRYYEGLLGLILLKRGDFQSAQAHLQKALSLTPIEWEMGWCGRPEFLSHLAEAYEQAGRWVDAQKSYEEIISDKTQFWGGPGNILILARSYYKLGNVLERIGDKAGAAARYRKFLDHWKDADPGLPEVADARKRLAGLTGS